MPIIELKQITKVYGFGDATTVALDNVSLTIEKGEFVAIMGPSGSGKSTLMNIIGLLDTPTDGEYVLDSSPTHKLRNKSRAIHRREKIGFIFQSFNLLPRMNVIENVALPLTYSRIGHTKRLEKASAILSRLGIGEREYYMPNQLSGGQLQRAAIARALVNDPRIILADEPTGNLDTKTTKVIMDVLKEINEQGNTIIMVTHNPTLAEYADRVITVVDGVVVPEELTEKKKASTKKKSKSSPKKKKPKKKTDKKKSSKSTKSKAKKTTKKTTKKKGAK